MFDLYTEDAKRTIFFARYEAGKAGSSSIETEHLLLALLREDKTLAQRLRGSARDFLAFVEMMEQHAAGGEKVPPSMELPVSPACQRALEYGAEEAAQANQNHVGTAHLLLGLLREEQCFAAQQLRERDITLDWARDRARQS